MLNLRCGNAVSFSKHCNIVLEAESLRGTDGWRTTEISSVDTDFMTLKNVDDTKIPCLQKVKASDMGATMCHKANKQFVVSWSFHMVDVGEDNPLENRIQASPVPKVPSSISVVPHDLTSKCITIGNFLLLTIVILAIVVLGNETAWYQREIHCCA